MTTSTQINSSSATVQTISDDSADILIAALGEVYSVVQNYGDKEPLAPFNCDDAAQRETICVRALKALIHLQAVRAEEKVRRFRGAVQKVCDTYMDLACGEKEEFDGMSDNLRKRLGLTTFPDTVAIPLGALVDSFPVGTPQETMIKMLHDMGYKVSKAKDNTFTLRVPFVAV